MLTSEVVWYTISLKCKIYWGEWCMKWMVRISNVLLTLLLIPEMFVMNQLFLLNDGLSIAQTDGIVGVYMALFIGVVFLSIMRSCFGFYFYIEFQNQMQKIAYRKGAYEAMKKNFLFLSWIILFVPIVMLVLNIYYQTQFIGVATYYLFLVILMHFFVSVKLYRHVIYPRISDVIQSFSLFLVFFVLLGFVPFTETVKSILYASLSVVFVLLFIRFIQTRGLFFRAEKGNINLERGLYYTREEQAGTFYDKYIRGSHTVTNKQATDYGYLVMNAVYFRKTDVALLEKICDGTMEIHQRFVICDFLFYEKMLQSETTLYKTWTLIVLLEDEEQLDNGTKLPEIYDEMVQSYIGKYKDATIGETAW